MHRKYKKMIFYWKKFTRTLLKWRYEPSKWNILFRIREEEQLTELGQNNNLICCQSYSGPMSSMHSAIQSGMLWHGVLTLRSLDIDKRMQQKNIVNSKS